MYKFKHFTTEEMNALCCGATFGLTDTHDGRFDGLSVTLSPEFYKETAANIINRALDAELVQRVVDHKSHDENKTIRKEKMKKEESYQGEQVKNLDDAEIKKWLSALGFHLVRKQAATHYYYYMFVSNDGLMMWPKHARILWQDRQNCQEEIFRQLARFLKFMVDDSNEGSIRRKILSEIYNIIADASWVEAFMSGVEFELKNPDKKFNVDIIGGAGSLMPKLGDNIYAET